MGGLQWEVSSADCGRSPVPNRYSIFLFTTPVIAAAAFWGRWLTPTTRVASASLLGLLCLSLLPGCTDAKALTPTVSPSASVDEGTRHKDLGQLTEGDAMQHTFLIRNTTDKPFTLTAIKKSCGCETANVTEGMIVPAGELLSVPYSIPAHGSGERTGQLVITTDASDELLQKIVLTLRAEIQPLVWASPTQVMFGTVMEGESAEQEVRVESILPGLLDSYREVATSRSLVHVELLSQSSEALVFQVVLAPDAPVGAVQDFIHICFDNNDHPQLNVKIEAQKNGPISAAPRVLIVPAFAAEETHTRRMRITSIKPGKFTIKRVECAASVTVDPYPAEPQAAFDLTIRFARPTRGESLNTIVFHTDPPGQVLVPVRYVSTPAP